MADLIDLEEYPENFDDDGCGYRRNADSNDKATSSISSSDSPTPEQPRFITIKSYTEICIETGDKVENTPATSARAKYPQDDGRKSRPDAQVKREEKKTNQQRVQKSEEYSSSRGVKCSTTDERGARKKDGGSQTRRTTRMDKQERAPACWLTILVCCCGVNNEYKWYSLTGKGICLLIPMVLVYVIVSFVVLPFLTAAALGVAVFLCFGVASYLAVATNKVGVSLDESDSSCFKAVYGSWV